MLPTDAVIPLLDLHRLEVRPRSLFDTLMRVFNTLESHHTCRRHIVPTATRTQFGTRHACQDSMGTDVRQIVCCTKGERFFRQTMSS